MTIGLGYHLPSECGMICNEFSTDLRWIWIGQTPDQDGAVYINVNFTKTKVFSVLFPPMFGSFNQQLLSSKIFSC